MMSVERAWSCLTMRSMKMSNAGIGAQQDRSSEWCVYTELLAALGLQLGNMSKLTKSLNITEDDDTPPVVYASAYAVSKIIQNAQRVACTMTGQVLISTMFNILLDLRFLGDVRQLCAMALCVLDDKPSRP